MRTFYKYHGLGNDYIFFDCLEEGFPTPKKLAKQLSDRHFSVGGDGIVLILPSEVADVRMRMFNADGSEGNMCGNAIRCVAKYLYEVRGMHQSRFSVETKAGIRILFVHTQRRSGEVYALTVDMGAPVFEPDAIPALFEGDSVVAQPLIVGEETYRVTCLSMGNPHCVVFGEDPDGLDLGKVGPLFENHPAFPARINTEFVLPMGRNELRMRVFERGSGETMACGTGACAAAVASVLNGYSDKGAEITVHLKGGDLAVRYTDSGVLMKGPAEFAFRGEVEI